MNNDDLPARLSALSDHEEEHLLHAVMDRLLEQTPDLHADTEESARELIAAFLTHHGAHTTPDDIVRPSTDLNTHIHATLTLLADDPTTTDLVRDTLDTLPEDTQMFADPVTAAVILGALVAFLQTRFDLRIARKAGKTEFSFTLAKKAATDRTVAKVVEAVQNAAVK